jgi:tetratricopeptide (TPR) repeat protein
MRYVILCFILLSGAVFPADKYPKLSNFERHWFEGQLDSLQLVLAADESDQSVYNRAYIHMLQGQYAAAQELGERIREKHPTWYDYLMGMLAHRQENYDDVITYLGNYYEVEKDNIDVLLTLAEAMHAQKRYKQARRLLMERLDDFDDERLYAAIARSYDGEGMVDEAIRWLISGEKVFPSMEILWQQIEVYDQVNNSNQIYEKGLKLVSMYRANRYRQQLKDIFARHDIDTSLTRPPNRQMRPLQLNFGEILEYEVSYGFFFLGDLRIQVVDTVVYRGRSCFAIEYLVDTAPALPFFTMHHRYIAYLDRETMVGYKSFLFTDETDGYYRKSYIMDYRENKLHVYRLHVDGRIDYVNKYMPDVAVDPMSLLFYARQLVRNKTSATITTIINENYKTADVNIQNQQESIDILKQETTAEKVYAKANFEGIAGMSGDVWGWFIDAENAAVPAIGKVQIFLGNVTLTLKKWRP